MDVEHIIIGDEKMVFKYEVFGSDNRYTLYEISKHHTFDSANAKAKKISKMGFAQVEDIGFRKTVAYYRNGKRVKRKDY